MSLLIRPLANKAFSKGLCERQRPFFIHEGEGWFSIIDVSEVLTDSSIPKRYWIDLKKVVSGSCGAGENIAQTGPKA